MILISPVIDYTLNLISTISERGTLDHVRAFVRSHCVRPRQYREEGDDLKQITEAETFSRGELLLALVRGSPRSSPEVSRVITRLAAITGLDETEVLR